MAKIEKRRLPKCGNIPRVNWCRENKKRYYDAIDNPTISWGTSLRKKFLDLTDELPVGNLDHSHLFKIYNTNLYTTRRLKTKLQYLIQELKTIEERFIDIVFSHDFLHAVAENLTETRNNRKKRHYKQDRDMRLAIDFLSDIYSDLEGQVNLVALASNLDKLEIELIKQVVQRREHAQETSIEKTFAKVQQDLKKSKFDESSGDSPTAQQ